MPHAARALFCERVHQLPGVPTCAYEVAFIHAKLRRAQFALEEALEAVTPASARGGVEAAPPRAAALPPAGIAEVVHLRERLLQRPAVGGATVAGHRVHGDIVPAACGQRATGQWAAVGTGYWRQKGNLWAL